jgi:acetyl esterase/lipase
LTRATINQKKKNSIMYEIETIKDVSYRANSKLDAHKLDIYIPVQRAKLGNTPTVVIFPGGGWKRGGRQRPAYGGIAMSQGFVSRGYVVFTASYRLSSEHPNQVHDVRDALAYAYEHAVHFGGSKVHFFSAGHSAGAHLSTLALVDDQYLSSTDVCVRAHCAISGVYRLHHPFGDAHCRNRLFRRVYMAPFGGDDKERLDKCSPTYVVMHKAVRMGANVKPSDIEQRQSDSDDDNDDNDASDSVENDLIWDDRFDESMTVSSDDSVDDAAAVPSSSPSSDAVAVSSPSPSSSSSSKSTSAPAFLVMNARFDVGLQPDGKLLHDCLQLAGYQSTYVLHGGASSHVSITFSEQTFIDCDRFFKTIIDQDSSD